MKRRQPKILYRLTTGIRNTNINERSYEGMKIVHECRNK